MVIIVGFIAGSINTLAGGGSLLTLKGTKQTAGTLLDIDASDLKQGRGIRIRSLTALNTGALLDMSTTSEDVHLDGAIRFTAEAMQTGTGIKMDADGVVPNIGATVQKKAEYGMNLAKKTMKSNPSKYSDQQRKDFKTADNYLKSGKIETDVQRKIPGSQQYRLDIAADEVNLDSQRNKPKKNTGFKFGLPIL